MGEIVAIIPAVNEPGIGNTIESLLTQTVTPTEIVVAWNNGTNDTTSVAVENVRAKANEAGVRLVLMNLGQITGRKAGALNRALDQILTSPKVSMVLPMDADTVMVSTWIESALSTFEGNEGLGGVGAVFRAENGAGWLWGCQKREWLRYEEEIERTRQTFVLSGTAALIKVEALTQIKNWKGWYYDENAITEDFRITIHLKELGWELASPVECVTFTETMPNVKMLFKQRRRWSLGALQTVFSTGFNRTTALYWKQQVMLSLAATCLMIFAGLSVYLIPKYGFELQWWSFILVGILILERVSTIWDRGNWKDRVMAALVIPELLYALILQASYVGAVIQFIRKSNGEWSHV